MREKRFIPGIILLIAALILGASAQAISDQWKITQNDEWCERCSDDGEYCEVREITLPVRTGTLELNASPNGGIRVEAWDRDEVLLSARVSVRAKQKEEARDIASRIEISTDNQKIHAVGPRRHGKKNWSVSYRLMVPRTYDLSLETTNGGITIEGVRGHIRFEATNGGIQLSNLSGDVSGETTNGSLTIELAGERWDGNGLDVATTNGRVHVGVPKGYSAKLEAGTTNGRINFDFPVTVQGTLGRHMSVVLGDGGPRLRIKTTNGGIKIYEQ